jgi:hypothetical protein
MEAINIWSGSSHPIGAVLTNPTELAYRKGKLKHHYPILFEDVTYVDAEAAYQAYKMNELEQDMTIMISVIIAKLNQYPQIVDAIVSEALVEDRAGGENWLKSCNHRVTGKSRWEGNGVNSKFIVCLVQAYQIVTLTK